MTPKETTNSENLYIIDKFDVKEKLNLRTSLVVPSTINAYSIGVQYMREWFLKKFPQDFFKSINIEGRHTFYDFRKLSREEMLKRLKPALSISPQLQFDYNRENIDDYPYGVEMFSRTCNYKESFFKDEERNLYLGFVSEMMIIDFTFKIKLSTRAQQVDLYKFLQLAMRVGYSQGEDVCMDYHIPYGTMLQIATDAGFEVVDDKIKDITKFVNYLNKHSLIPIMYKLRTMTGNDEFFLRANDVYTWITCPELSQDDGDKEGMVNTSFIIEMRAQLKLPSPKFYVYFSQTKHVTIERRNQVDDVFGWYNVQKYDVPPTNKYGWNQLLTTEYFEEITDKPLEIDFSDFFKDTDLGSIIEYNNQIAISSSVCIDFIIHNHGRDLEYTMDWETMIMKTNDVPLEDITYISIYVDMEYVNKILINKSNALDSRLSK